LGEQRHERVGMGERECKKKKGKKGGSVGKRKKKNEENSNKIRSRGGQCRERQTTGEANTQERKTAEKVCVEDPFDNTKKKKRKGPSYSSKREKKEKSKSLEVNGGEKQTRNWVKGRLNAKILLVRDRNLQEKCGKGGKGECRAELGRGLVWQTNHSNQL